jgi:hypothetical protein
LKQVASANLSQVIPPYLSKFLIEFQSAVAVNWQFCFCNGTFGMEVGGSFLSQLPSNCAEWQIATEGSTLIIGKLVGDQDASVTYDDVATTIDGGEFATDADKAKALVAVALRVVKWPLQPMPLIRLTRARTM